MPDSESFLRSREDLDVEQSKEMTKVHHKLLLRELHGVRAAKARHCAQSMLVSLSPFYISAQGCKSVFRKPSLTKPQI